ncbi:uncharacterized protein PpBr36_09774 [Pyricularia pennisetigena]|uniref:uncharacterized protein n=1 Tax=Pyricularia pennisetigena TaxID=1578925 RepID=UPI00114DFAAE|nr:uncharacterized protein PpBr36_09774 [Pyricularia pennisetigena]TLS22244.1 hypothetical protein PpBr36_09774 [Pyricularia pennisetigena]
MPLQKPRPAPPAGGRDNNSFLSPIDYDADARSIHSDQEADSDDDMLLQRARNSRELRAHDRLVFMEEEETDKLVLDARRRTQEKGRRESGLTIPNPLKLIRRYSDTSLRSSTAGDNEDGREKKVDKRKQRKNRRKMKKDRLLAEAQHGEDGELMYEMEEGGMKEGSETGDSSEREDSEEVDRLRMKFLEEPKRRRWSCCQWTLIHTIIAAIFALLALGAWKLSMKDKSHKQQQYTSNGTALFAPTTIIISLDGFRADFLNRGLTPRLNAFVKEGVSPLYMLPSFPSVTFPNHYTLVTGLYPESHGVVGNTFYDPALKTDFYYTDPGRSLDPKWWGGEPFWATAEKAGIRTAIHMWPGSEAHILGIEPSFLDKYDGKEKLSGKVSRILELLDKPGMEDEKADPKDMRPQLIAAYVPNVDADGHTYGPNSTEIRKTIQEVDGMMDDIFKGLEQRNLTGLVNVIVVSDHGMATTDRTRLLQLDDLVDLSKVEHIDGWPLVGLRPRNPEDLQSLYDELVRNTKDNPNVDIYLKDLNMPKRYHFSNNDRIAPLWVVPKTGWNVVQREEFDLQEAKAKDLAYHPRGLHGYDNEHPLMRAIFIARGPAFPHAPNSKLEPFQNIEVYNILCDSVGLEPVPNNGTLRLPFKPIGLHSPESPIPDVADPVTSSTATEKTPTQSVGVDHVPEPTQTESPGSNNGGGDGKDGASRPKTAKEKLEDLWKWFTETTLRASSPIHYSNLHAHFLQSKMAEMDNLRNEIDLQRAVVASLEDDHSMGSISADPEEIQQAKDRLGQLQHQLSSMQRNQGSSSRHVKPELGALQSPARWQPTASGSTSFQAETGNTPSQTQQTASSGLATEINVVITGFEKRVRVLTKQIQSQVKDFHRCGVPNANLLRDFEEAIDHINEEFEDDFNMTEAIARSLLLSNASFDYVSTCMAEIRARYVSSKRAAEQSLGKIRSFYAWNSHQLTYSIATTNGIGNSSSASPSNEVSTSKLFIPDKDSNSRGSHSSGVDHSRKRTYSTLVNGHEHLKTEPAEGTSKSQRTGRMTTPTRDSNDAFATPSKLNRGQNSDVIDLTGDDDDIYATIQKHSQKSTQSRNDSHGSRNPYRLHNSVNNSPYGQTHLVSRPAPSASSTQHVLPTQQQIPGGYVSSDSEDEFRRMNNLPPRSSTRQQPGQPSHNIGHLPWSSRLNPFANLTVPSAAQVIPSNSRGVANMHRPGNLQGGLFNQLNSWGSTSSMVSSAFSGLGNLINQTSSFDYLNLRDSNGNPLPSRLANFLESDDDHNGMGHPYYNPADDYRKKEEQAIRDMLASIRPDEDLAEGEVDETPEAMKFPLFPHQQLALKWMKNMETDELKKGGLLADDMGLGKTVSTLSLMVSRPSPNSDVKTNLIIGPVALIKQWEAEIANKLKPDKGMSVFLLHGSHKKPYSELCKFDVVMTTYGTLASEFKRMELYKLQFKKTPEEYAEDTTLQKKCPLLHSKSRFWRIILDEAQCVKNENTQAAKAVSVLRSEHRWCLTGTPMMNGAHELFSLIRFLRIAPYNSATAFKSAFGCLTPKGTTNRSMASRTAKAIKQLQVVLKAIMLRREKTSKINGKPILELPPKFEEVVHVVFSEDEASFYRDLETSSRNQINKYIRRGTLRKNYAHALVLLLRLRQAACHPQLNTDVEYTMDPEVSEEHLLGLARSMSSDVVRRLKEIEAFSCPICMDAVEDPAIVLPCGHALCRECLTQWISNSELRSGDNNSAKCPECRGQIDSKKVVNYGTFKQVHMPELMETNSPEDEAESEEDKWAQGFDSDSDTAGSETESGDEVDDNGDLKDFIVGDSDKSSDTESLSSQPKFTKGKGKAPVVMDSDDEELSPVEKPSKKRKSKTQAKAKKSGGASKKKKKAKEEVKPHQLAELRKDAKRNKASRKRYFDYLDDNWITSAKISKCTQLLSEIRQKGEKTLIFSVFTSLLDLLEVGIRHDLGLQVCRYDGSLGRDARDKAVQDFQFNPNATIMLVSLRAGNAGLNLTAASQVIIMDPFWNPYIEMQAVDRAHRMGQLRSVHVQRLVVQETVEDRIINLQEQKRTLVEAALNGDEAKNLARLSDQELGYLFGLNQQSNSGQR